MFFGAFDLGICFFEGYMYFILWNHFMELRVKKRWFYTTIITAAVVCLFFVNQLRLSKLNLGASILISVILCQILFVDSFKKKVFYILLCGFILWSCEFFMMVIFRIPLGSKALDYYNNPSKMVLLILSSKLLTFLVIWIICTFTRNVKDNFFPTLVPYFSIFPFSCMLVYVGITYSNINLMDESMASSVIITGCVVQWIANVVLFLIYDRMVSMVNRVRDYELTDIKRNLENQHYTQIEEINRKHSNIIHDMNNYLNTIEKLAEKENNEEIVSLITSLNHHIIKVDASNYCENYIMNAILNGKKQEAITKGVDFHVYIEPGFERPEIEDIDVISVMSNLLDNAIEAGSQCPQGFVNVQMYKSNDGKFTTIKIKNNYKHKPVEKYGEFITRKQNPGMHGIGIHHVKTIVEKYGGWITIEYENGEFCVTVMFA